MGKGKVETFLSNDGKTRLKGKVGSHSTLVKQAKTPTTDINDVVFETDKTRYKAAAARLKKQKIEEKRLASIKKAGGYSVETDQEFIDSLRDSNYDEIIDSINGKKDQEFQEVIDNLSNPNYSNIPIGDLPGDEKTFYKYYRG